MTHDDQLPPLPAPMFMCSTVVPEDTPTFTEDQMREYGRQCAADELSAAIAHFEKVARETDNQSPLGKAHWCRAAAAALRNGWHRPFGEQA